MSVSRPVRIPRGRPTAGGPATRPSPALDSVPTAGRAPEGELRRNRAGTQRATRLALLYVVAVGVLYGALAAYARSTPTGGSSGATSGLTVFGVLAVVLAAAGALFSLAAAPRAVELNGPETFVIGRFGGRLRLSTTKELAVRVVRTFPTGLLSSAPVESVEVVQGRIRRTLLIEEGLLPRRSSDRSKGS